MAHDDDDDGRAKETGGRVGALRRARSLSIRDLAKESGVSTDAIVKLEHGARAARPSTIRKVAQALGVEPEYLLEGREPPPVPVQGEMVLALAARGRADAEGRDAVEVYRELRENPPSLEEILGGVLPADVAEGRARDAASYLVGLDPRRKERVPEGERSDSGEVSAQRAGRLGA